MRIVDSASFRQRDPTSLLPFDSRETAGALLAERLAKYAGKHALVLGIPRGGVTIAAAIADRIGGELDVAVARKLGAPMQPELAVGAITADGTRYINTEMAYMAGVTPEYLASIERKEQAEAQRRERRFRGDKPKPTMRGRPVILVDDGLATGATMRAAIAAVRQQEPSSLIVAVPVGAVDTCSELRESVDEIICLAMPEPFQAVGLHYRDFRQVEDEEVAALLAEFGARHAPG